MVTGAGRGLGRAYAELLARRGASVVVNDLGGSVDGTGADSAPATSVAREISDAGGAAVADGSDISTATGGQAVIDNALTTFGGVDIVINNAGIIKWAGLPDVDGDNLAAHLAVHTVGSFNVVRAAWPHMAGQGYGRIVTTTSSGLFGLATNTSYATAKAAVIGLTRSLVASGAGLGIKANLIAPAAVTRMAGGGAESEEMAPELVAPIVAFLAHESCPVSGEIYTAGAGRFARLFIASTEGYVHTRPAVTVEDVAEHWDRINDEEGYWVPTDLMDWSTRFMAHLQSGR